VAPFLTTKRIKDISVEFKVEPVEQKLRRYNSNWLSYVTRMNNNRMPKILLNYSPNGGRRLGRPLKRLLDVANVDLLTLQTPI
jgi:hypothetical protein